MTNILKVLSGICTPSVSWKAYRRFEIDGRQVGLIRPEVFHELVKFPEVFNTKNPDYVTFVGDIKTLEDRTTAMESFLMRVKKEEKFKTLNGWRNETYDVKIDYSSQTLFKMDRSATCLFGIKNYGVTINGYVQHPDMGLCLWLQKRSKTKSRWPGVWDALVGGGVTSGKNILQTLRQEAAEEASIPPGYHENILSAGTIACRYESDEGIFPNTAFVFDLRLPLDFTPKNSDGEVEYFRLVSVKECLDIIERGEFKQPNVLVVIDFLIRHSVITPYSNPDYISIVQLLHAELQNLR